MMSDFDFESAVFDDQVFDFNFSTPVSRTHVNHDDAPEAEQQTPDSSDEDSVSSPLLYTLIWKLQLRKGRMTKLTEDTVEDIAVAPGTYWENELKSELAELVQRRLPAPQYEPEETKIILSTSKRREPDFQRRFDALNVSWTTVEDKLRSWNDQEYKLTVTILFIYKESEPAAASTTKKTGRGATSRQLAARDELLAQQVASGTRPVWKDVYELFTCSSAVCTNQGFFCWREPVTQKHYKLDTNIMDKLVDLAEEGAELRTHDAMPLHIQELCRTHEQKYGLRKKRKTQETDHQPIVVNVHCQGHNEKFGRLGSSNGVAQDLEPKGRSIKLTFPMRRDKAPRSYCDWLCEQVDDQAWQQAYQRACAVTIENGYDLQRLHDSQDSDAKMLIDNGVLSGIAIQFVSRIEEWLEALHSDSI